MKTAKLTSSMADIATKSPAEVLGPESRYVVIADLRMGDGGRRDELAGSRKALFGILSRYYLPRGYTLVLNGDVEDLRNFWYKDILAAWPKMYALFDVFAEAGSVLVMHGHQAASPFAGRDYLSDYIQHWLASSKRPRREGPEKEGQERFKTERRLYRAASRLGVLMIQGYTRRPYARFELRSTSIRGLLERVELFVKGERL
jgi:hypothetical protein